MNYFAHGRRALDDPWRLAGTALPDWLRRLDRRLRIPRDHLEQVAATAQGHRARLVDGVRHHHDDDHWFHQSDGFLESSGAITRRLRAEYPGAPGFRASFTAHLLVEMLLDHVLVEERAGALDRYYTAVESLDLDELEHHAAVLTGRPVAGLSKLVRVFARVRFLEDYAEDGLVVERLDAVHGLVRLRALPEGMAGLLPGFRKEVAARRPGLLPETAQLPTGKTRQGHAPRGRSW